MNTYRTISLSHYLTISPTAMQHDTIIVLDFGSQYAQLIARRIREQAVYSELVHWNDPAEKALAGKQVKGFILSGGPASVYEPGAPTFPPTSWSPACLYWASATACSSSPTTWAAASPQPPPANTAPPRSKCSTLGSPLFAGARSPEAKRSGGCKWQVAGQGDKW